MEALEQALLRGGLEVDEHVAAADQVEVGERGIGEQVVGGEGDRVAQRSLDLEAVAGGPEEAVQPLGATRVLRCCAG